MGINVVDIAHGDCRFARLGRDLGCTRLRHETGLGVMIGVWALARRLKTNVLTRDQLAPLVPPTSLIVSDLAEEVAGGFRIKGVKVPKEAARTAKRSELELMTADLVGMFNKAFKRRIDPRGYVDAVGRVVAAGYTFDAMRAAMMVAIQRWAKSEWARRMSPMIVFRLTCPPNKQTTFHTLFAEAGELWAKKHPGVPVPWRRQ